MRAWKAMGAGGQVILVVLGAIGISAGGYMLWRVAQSPTIGQSTEVAGEPQKVPSETPTVAEAPAEVAAAPVPQDNPVPAPIPPPRFVNWRVEMDGAAVVAGLAEPGAKVIILVNGLAVSETDATPAGEFVSLFTLPPTDQPSLISLSMTLADGRVVPSQQTVALEAIMGPIVATEATVEPELTPTGEATPPKVAAPAAILVTEDGAVVLQDPATADPVAASDVSIDTISYTPQGDVQLGGRGQAGAFVRFYLDNVLLQTVLVPDGGKWLTTLNKTEPGIYRLRADQVDAVGKVTSRFETPFKRETLEALASVVGGAVADLSEAPVVVDEPPVIVATAEPETALTAASDTDATATPRVTKAEPDTQLSSTVLNDPVASVEDAGEARPAQGETIVEDASAAQDNPLDPLSAADSPVSITVQPGFTLWGIAQQKMGSGVMYVQVYEANKDKIKNPDLIYPGQVFTMPNGDGG